MASSDDREPSGPRVPSHERRVLTLAVLAGLPGSALALGLLFASSAGPVLKIGVSCALVALWLGFARAAQQRVVRSLLTLANMLGAVREGDFSVRGRKSGSSDALGQAFMEINALTETLQEQRLGALDATALLRRVMAEVEVGIFAFDAEQRLRLVNRHGERMLGLPAERAAGRTADALGLAVCFGVTEGGTVELALGRHGDGDPGGEGGDHRHGRRRWLVRRSGFRQGGLPHQLLVLSEASQALREEEHDAWKRLVRVLSHEINNSLAPISSVAGSLEELAGRDPRPADWEEDLHSGLAVIAGRSEGLRRIMASYARLAKLPEPKLRALDVEPWLRNLVAIETRMRVEVVPGPPAVVKADADQLDQLGINLIANAVDASLEARSEGSRESKQGEPGVRVGWECKGATLIIWVEDDGLGIANPQNLFVPFFTTKPNGSGIGLALSRQIAEGHRGSLSLRNRDGTAGCRAELCLPLAE